MSVNLDGTALYGQLLFAEAGIAPPGQEGWREAPGWWFKFEKNRA
jgi:hypothetical protein